MDQSKRNEPSRPDLTPADALLACIGAHEKSPYVQITPLRAILPLLKSYIRSTEARLQAVESALTPEQRQRARLEAQALKLVTIAREEGVLLDPIDRPTMGPPTSDPFPPL